MKTKNKMYRTLIRLTNCITWQWQPGSIATGDEAKVRRFKRRILKKIYGHLISMAYGTSGTVREFYMQHMAHQVQSGNFICSIWHIRYSQGILCVAYGTSGTVRECYM